MSENDIMKISNTIIRIAHPQKLLIFSPSKEQTKAYIVKIQELYETIENICN